MKKFLLAIFTMFVMMLGSVVKAHAIDCNANEINTGTSCETSKFEITTTNIPENTVLSFSLAATGTFYVDWGDGSAVQTINTTGAYGGLYTHTCISTGVKKIRFGGIATGYSDTLGTISFGSSQGLFSEYITSVSGSFGDLFPSLGSSAEQNPKFSNTFKNCRLLTSIPSDLFGTYTATDSMFAGTFYGCTGLTSIPSDLFSGVTGSAHGMFVSTFDGCTGLTSIPSDLFSGVTGSASIMFQTTFAGCTGLTSIPSNLFRGVTGSASGMFNGTFYDCTSLTSIPSNLFSGVTNGDYRMFEAVFNGCTSLTSIPSNLFSGVNVAAQYEFQNAFYGCTNLSGYIPANTFSGLIEHNSPTTTDMWKGAFGNTQLATSCPSGTTQYITGYEGDNNSTTWNGKVACQPDVSVPGSEITSPAINSNVNVASTSYVMGAHRDAVNTAIEYVNAENTRAIAAEGILSNLTTTNKSSLVAAINEVKSTASNATDSYKDLSNLSAAGNAVIDERVTTNGSNGTFNAGQNTDLSSNTLGGAINELASDYKNADTTINNKIGNTPLTTTSQTLTGAIEEVKDIAENASDIDAENSEFTADVNSNISASTIGGAINELASDYQNADTTINNTIGNTPLTTTSQTLTGAIEEVNTTAADATSDANDVTSAMNSADVTLYTTWGDETNGIANINSMTGE